MDRGADQRKWKQAAEKAVLTAAWAKTMAKWKVTRSHRSGAKWQFVEFLGAARSESQGIVDILAIRKDHRKGAGGFGRGDRFDIVLIQVKGGSAGKPTENDVDRLKRVAKYHRARAVALAEWKRGTILQFHVLTGRTWKPVDVQTIFN